MWLGPEFDGGIGESVENVRTELDVIRRGACGVVESDTAVGEREARAAR